MTEQKFDFEKARAALNEFRFSELFIDYLGWVYPNSRKEIQINAGEVKAGLKPIAELGGAAVFEVHSSDGKIPDKKIIKEIHSQISKKAAENLLIFTDEHKISSLWLWNRKENGKNNYREHFFFKDQPGDLFLGKLSAMFTDISEFDENARVSITKAAEKLKNALDIERVTKKFFNEFKEQKISFESFITGIDRKKDQSWYASVLLNRLMFVYFLQSKRFINQGDTRYLQNKLKECAVKKELYYHYLKELFTEGFAKKEEERTEKINKKLGQIPYLNGGLFLPHRIEVEYRNISVSNEAFEKTFHFLDSYSWHLDDSPGGKDDDINPSVLGYIFEKYINQKEFGAYYTRNEMTEYLSERTIHKYILNQLKEKLPAKHRFAVGTHGGTSTNASLYEVIVHADADVCRIIWKEILPNLSILDPACGSGAFLVAAMKTLISIYAGLLGKIEFLNDKALKKELEKIKGEHPSLSYYIKKRIISDNLYGVDIMEEGTEIAKLRLFLALVSSIPAGQVKDLEPLPNIDFNILSGNSLIGLINVDESKFDEIEKSKPNAQDYKDAVQAEFFKKVSVQKNLFGVENAANYRKLIEEREVLIHNYKNYEYSEMKDLLNLRQNIQNKEKDAQNVLNKLLLDEFVHHRIQYEEATWDEKKKTEGKPKKRPLTMADIAELKPFHWGYEFSEIFRKGGFDIILTNPPWEIFKPNSKEFFLEFSDLVSRNNMDIKSFEKEKAKLLKNESMKAAWLSYLSRFTHISLYFRNSNQYKNQISVVNGKKAGTDINLYKLFLELSYNLLKSQGDCGIIIPSGIYTDLGAKQLRSLLFQECNIDRLYGLSNEKFIFENVHHSFKFCLLTFEKGRKSESFDAVFRINTREAIRSDQLGLFLSNRDILTNISFDLVNKLSPDSLSIMEFKSEKDIKIAEKMLKYPMLGEKIEGSWNLKLSAEFHMTNDSHLFKTKDGEGRLPLYEGKMIHQFNSKYANPKYWIDEKQGRKSLGIDSKDRFYDFENYRLALRSVASSTNERALIVTLLPKLVFCGNSLIVSKGRLQIDDLLFIITVLDSFIIDYYIKGKVTNNLNMFYIYQLPVPRLSEKSAGKEKEIFQFLVERSAKLICTTEEFADLWFEVMGTKWTKKSGVTEEKERMQLRAEIDAAVGHLYGITEDEFVHILATFPLVKEEVKQLTLEEFRKRS